MPGSFDVESSEDGFNVAAQSNVATSTITITPLNDDPAITLPGSSVSYSEGDPPTLIDATAMVSDPDDMDFDTGVLTVDIIAGATINDRLAIRDEGAGAGNISVSGSDVSFDFGSGPVVIGAFSGGSGLADPLLVNLNANADQNAIQALVRNITYENVAALPSQANRVIEFVVTDGDGGVSAPVAQTVIFSVVTALWLTSQDDTIPSDTNLPDWKRGDVVEFGGGAMFGETTTSGDFSLLFALFLNDTSQADLRAIHYVTRSLTLGGGANTFDVQPGDLIAALDIGGTLLSSNSLPVSKNDVFVFRPDTPGNYATGTFTMLLQDPVSAEIHALTLVEEDVLLADGTNLTAGTFLLAHSGPHEDVHLFQATGVGPGAATSGSKQPLLDGSLLGFNQLVHGLELLESETTIGDTTIPATRLLMSVNGSATVAGQAVTPQDIVTLHVTGTEQGMGTAATATMLLDGDNVALTDGTETFDGLTVARNNPLAANTPSVTDANTLEDTQSDSGLVISRHPDDGLEVSHFKITNITGGTLFENDGITPIVNDGFILFATGDAGLKFTPDANATADGHFTVQASTAANNSGLGGGTVDATITITPVGDTPSVTNANTSEDTQTTTGLVISRHVDDGNEVTHFRISNITGGELFQNDGITPINHDDYILVAEGQTGLGFTPDPDSIAPGSFDVESSEDGASVAAQSNVATATIIVTPVADTPSVTDASTTEDIQTTTGLQISRNPADGIEVTHFKITTISGGDLYQNDGTTPINDGEFISVTEGNAGLKFTPTANAIADGSFTVQASTASNDTGLGGSTVMATISVTPIADTPSVTNASTLEDTQTTAGLVITSNPVDGPEVTHFKITVVTGGDLYQNDGTTSISDGEFIAVTQGNAGLKFTPTPNSIADGSFIVQASTANNDTGLGGNTVMATITVAPVADTPSVTNASTLEDNQTTSDLVISRHADDGIEVSHFKITAITGGDLFQNDGITPINDGEFILYAEGNAGLKFTPDANSNTDGSFTIQASTANNDTGLGGSTVDAAITVIHVGDTPQVSNITTDEDTQSGPITLDRHSDDGSEVTHFRISNIANGSLFQNDGITPINHDDYIFVSQGQAGLRFTPDPDSTAPGSFDVESSEDGTNVAAQSNVATATITVIPVGDTPQVSNITTDEDIQSGPITLDRHSGDGSEVTHFRISNIANGALYQNDGLTPINDGDYILVAEGQVGLKFTPAPNGITPGSFDVEASENGTSVAAQSNRATSTITVTPVNDAPVLDNTGAMALTDVLQDSTNPPGNSVIAIISSAGGDRITDVDSGALEGIAVIGVNDANGTWEYSTDNGVNWQSFVAVGVANGSTDDTAAVLLDDDVHIRFVPNPGYVGSAGDIVFHAWDRTVGASGDTGVDASAQGGATPYSLDTETTTLSVIAVLGVTNLVPGAQSTDEDTSLIFSTSKGNPIAVTDGAGADLPLRTSLSVTNGTLTLATIGGLIFENGANGTPDMTITGLESAINAALDGLDYAPTGDYHGPANLQVATDDAVGLTAQYTFDNPGDPGHDDSPGGAHDATLVGGPTPIFDPARDSDVLRFDGADDHLQITGLLGNPQQVTLAAWVNMDAGFTSEALISLGENIAIRLDETISGVHGFFYDGAIAQPSVSNVFIAGTGWHHVVYTVDTVNQVQVLYIDGTPVASDNHIGAIVYSQGTDTYIGRHGVSAADFFHGNADEVRIYNRALSAAEVSSLFSERTADTDAIAITVDPINDAPVLSATAPMLTTIMEDDTANAGDLIASILGASVTDVDTGAVQGIAVTGLSGGNGIWAYSTNGGGSWIPIGAVADDNARLLAADTSTRIRFQPNLNFYGTVSPGITFRAWDRTTGANGGTADTTANGDATAFSANSDTAAIVVNAVGDTPQAASIGTLEDTQSGPIALDRHSDDGSEVTHFRISNIANGALFQNDGVTPIGNDDYILVAEGQAGLRFTPDPDSTDPGSFDVESSEDGTNVAAQSNVATSAITVTPVADTPVVTDASTLEDTQTTSGLVLSVNPVDGLEVTHFKITAISGGLLYQNDGTTPIDNGDFINVIQGNAGLRFTPTPNSAADGSFTVQASTANNDTGLGGDPAQATITVMAVNDNPTAHAGGPTRLTKAAR